MAQLTFTTTAAQDAAVQYFTDRYNARMFPPVPLTAKEYAVKILLEKLDAVVARATEERRESKAELYQKATAEDQATIDGILAKYQG